MASLNTLRTRFGIVLTVVIAFALLAFVLSLKTEMGFSGNDPKVGSIDGDKIKYSEYIEEYERVKMQSGASESDPQQAEMLSNAAWQGLFAKHVLEPGFDEAGITIGEAERLSMISGEHPSQALYNVFADPRTGVYDVAAVSDFLAQAETNVQAQRAWNYLNEQAVLERRLGKYLGLVRGGAYVNALEVAQGVEAANHTYRGKLVGRKYAAIPDSLFTVSSSEIKSFYRAHKDRFKQTPSRTISYVVFYVRPTDDDMLAIEKQAKAVGEEFAAADDIRGFVRGNRNGRINERYVSAAQLSEEEADAFFNDRMYGPVLKNDEWIMARVVDRKMAPDTLGIRHIVLPYTQEKLADSLLNALRGGADFAKTAMEYSAYDATAADGGDLGAMPFSAFTGEFSDALAGAKEGDIVKVASGDAIQLIQVYRADKPSKHVRVADISSPVEASAETRRNIHNEAGTFMVNAKGSLESFNEAASAANQIPRTASIAQGAMRVTNLLDSHDIVRWANNAEKGDVSEIFTNNGNYVIAILTDIDDNKYMTIKQATPQIRRLLLRDKKHDYIVKQLAGATLEEQARSLDSQITEFDGLNRSAYYIDRVGVEPRVVGAITTTAEKGVLSAPVKGSLGTYVFVVDEIETQEKQTGEAEKVRAQALIENSMQQWALPVVQQMADIEDMRPMYL